MPFETLTPGFYQLQIAATDPEFDDKLFISEWLNVKEQHHIRHHVIDYYNSTNNDINYATGIGFRLRIPYLLDLKWRPATEQETTVTDTRTVTIENKSARLLGTARCAAAYSNGPKVNFGTFTGPPANRRVNLCNGRGAGSTNFRSY